MGIVNRNNALYMATGVDNTGLYKGKQEAMGILKTMAKEITSFDIFGGIGISAGLAFTKAAASAYDFEKRFQKSMLEVATLSKEVGGSLTDYMNRVMDITRKVPVAGDEAAKALYQIVSAGHDGANGMKILEVSAKAAIGGVTDTATAADTVTTVLNAYKMDASEAQKVSDLLFTTVKLGKTTFGELGHSIAQAAPVAAAYGVEIEQVLAAVASLTKQGTPTAQAMTQIRAAIMATSKALGDGAFKTRTLQEALEEVAKRAGGSESRLRKDITEVEAVNAVLGMTGKNAQSTASDLEKMQESLGAAEEAFQTMLKGAENQLKLLENNVTAALRPLGESILKEISGVAESVNKAFTDGELEGSLQNIVDLTVAVTSAFVGYKGSIMAVSAAEKIHSTVNSLVDKQRTIEIGKLVLSQGFYDAESASIVKNTSTRVLLTKALKAQAVAQLKNVAAMATNPYVLAAIAFTTLSYAIYKVATTSTEAEKAQKRLNKAVNEFNKDVNTEQAEIDRLFDKLRNTNKETSLYKKTKDEIIKKYGTYLQGLNKEVSALNDVEAAYRAISSAAKQAAADRAIEKSTQTAQENWAESKGKIVEDLKKELESLGMSDGASDAFIETINLELKETGKLSDETAKKVEKLRKVTEYTGSTGAKYTSSENTIQPYIDKLINNDKLLDKIYKDINTKFGISTNEYQNLGKENVEAYITAFESALNKFKETGNKQVLKVGDKMFSFGSEEEITLQLKKLQQVKKELEKEDTTTGGNTKTNDDLKKIIADIKTAEANILSLRKQSQQGLIDTKTVDDAVTKLDDLKKKFKSMTGKDYDKQSSSTNAINEQSNKITELEKKQARDRMRLSEDLSNQAEQARIDGLKSGFEKEQAQRNLNNKKELQALQRQKEDYIQAIIQFEKEAFEAKEELRAKENQGYVKKSFDSSSVSVDTSVFDGIINNTSKKQSNEKIREQEDSWREYLIKFGDYQQQRQAIIEKYDKAIEESGPAGDAATLYKEKEIALDSLDQKFGKSSQAMADIFEDTSNKSVSAIQSIIDKYDLLLKYMSGKSGDSITEEDLKAVGFTDKDLESIRNGTINIKDVTDAYKGLKGELKGKSPFQAFSNDIKDGLKGLKESKGDTKKFGEGLSTIGNAVTSFSPALKEFSSSISNIFGFDDEKIQSAIDGVSGLGTTAAGVGQMLSGDIVGGAMNAVKGIEQVGAAVSDLFNKNKNKEAEDTERLQNVTNKIAEVNEVINSLIEKRISLIKEATSSERDFLSETTKEAIDAQMLYYESQFKNVQDNWILAKKGKNNNLTLRDLGITSIEDLDKFLSDPNTLNKYINNGYSFRDYDLYKNIVDSYKSLGDAKKEINDTINELNTGITLDDAKNALDDLLMSADTTFEDISDSFESHMKKSIQNMVKSQYLNKELEQWYNEFSIAAEDGLDEKEVNELRKRYEDIFNSAQKQVNDALETAGIKLKTDTEKGVTGKLEAALTEGTANEVLGTVNMQAIDVRELKYMSSTHFQEAKACYVDVAGILEQTRLIAANTKATADSSRQIYDRLDEGMKDIKSELSTISKNTKNDTGRK